MAALGSAHFGRHGIRQRVVSVVLFGTFALLVGLWWTGWTALSRVRDQLVVERTLLARSVALHVERLLDDELEGLATLALSRDLSGDPAVAEHALNDAYRRSRLLDSVFVVILDGSLERAEPPAVHEITEQTRLAARRVARSNRPAITRAGCGGGCALFLVPLRDSAGAAIGVVGGTMPQNHPDIGRILAAAVPGPSARIELRDDGGTTVVRGGAPEVTDRAVSARLLSAEVPVDQLGWTIAIDQPDAAALPGVTGLRRAALLLSPIIFAVAVLLAWGAAASVVRPLGVLTRAAEAIASGNLEQPVPSGGTDEAGRLARALDDMRIALGRSIEDIARANQQLEARVDERTRELNRAYADIREHDRLRGQLLKKTISTQEEERKRVARELHDETSQTLNALMMGLDAAVARYPSEFTLARLFEARRLVGRLLEGVHRIILDLRPSMLDDLGLFSAIEWFARRHLEALGVAVRFETSGPDVDVRLPRETELALFRVAQETITNVARHAHADTVLIQCIAGDDHFVIDIEDDGEGFDMSGVTEDATSMRGLGLAGMRERVSLVGGRMTIDSAPGSGTHVTIAVPLSKETTLHA